MKDGRIVVDEPTDLPEEAEVEEVVYGDELSPEERAELDEALDRAADDSDAGRAVDAMKFLAEYRARLG